MAPRTAESNACSPHPPAGQHHPEGPATARPPTRTCLPRCALRYSDRTPTPLAPSAPKDTLYSALCNPAPPQPTPAGARGPPLRRENQSSAGFWSSDWLQSADVTPPEASGVGCDRRAPGLPSFLPSPLPSSPAE